MPETIYAPIELEYPHDVAVIFQNPANETVFVPCIGKKGVTFRPKQTIAVIGDPLRVSSNPQRYNGMKEVVQLHKLIMRGTLNIVSTPNNKNTDAVADRIITQ